MVRDMKSEQYNPYAGGEVPPCSAFLGNIDPIVIDGELIFRNINRVYYFISTSSASIISRNAGSQGGLACGCCSLGNTSAITNLQVSMATYIIGLYIHEVQMGNIRHSDKNKIHSDKKANEFICGMLKKKPEVLMDFIPSLSVIVSNSTAILNAFSYTVNITPLNYYILFVLNRLENHPGLFFANNNYVTEDPINFNLASLALRFPFED